MSKVIHISFLLVLIFFSSCLRSDPEKIFIHTDNSPDFDVYRGFHKGTVSLSAASNLIALNVLENIEFEYMPLKRSMAFMRRGMPICVLDKIKTDERLGRYLFSLPVNVYFSRRLYQQRGLPELNQATVDIVKLLRTYSEKKILLTSQISYGELLDKQITLIPDKQKVMRTSSAHASGLIEMFVRGRAEYALFYPQELHELGTPNLGRSYAIDGIEPYVIGYIMCNKTQRMVDVVENINRNLRELFRSGEMLELHLARVGNMEVDIFKQYYLQVLKVHNILIDE